MTQSKNVERVEPIDRGEVITAHYLNNMGMAINRNSQSLSGPKQQSALEESETGSAAILDLNFTETTRASSTVQITDSNGDTHSIEQIDSVTFTNANGDVLTLSFNNP